MGVCDAPGLQFSCLHTSTHSRNSGNRSPTDASAIDTKQQRDARARSRSRSRHVSILPVAAAVAIMVLLSSFARKG